jgi:anti-sigma B factor antagonist
VSTLQVQRQDLDDGFLVALTGEIDFSNSPKVRVEVQKALSTRPARLVLDLSAVPYMDSSGVATLVEALQGQRQHGGKLVLCRMQPRVRGIFDIARLDSVFTIVEDSEAALAV